MSLIYRLPLTNNLNNYGLYNGINYGHNLANQSDGKVGKCYSFGKTTTLAALTDSSGNFITNSQGQIIEVTNSNSSKVNSYIDIETDVAKQLSSDFSFSLWLRIDGWNTSYETYVYGGVGSSPWANYIFGLLRDSTNSTITFVISNGTTSTTTSCTSGTLTTGNWYHITCTYTSGMMRMYVDGTQVKEYATTIAPDFTKIGAFHLGALNSTTYQTNCSMNDFRLYDHCLSPMEVKELAKGLVLHYPLNRGGWGQENLLLNSNDLTLWSIESSGKIELQEDGYFKVSSKASGTTRYGIYYDFTFPEPNTYTFSVDVRDDWLIGVAPASTFTWTTANLSGTQGKKRISYTCTSTEENNKCRIYIAGIGTGGRVTYLKHPKLEKGSVATPWCPNSSDALATSMDLNGTTEYDCSGFCNNGTRTGTFTWTSDTPKYSVSTAFNGSQYITEDNEIETTDSTIAAWVKTSLSANAFILDCRNSSGAGKQPIYQYTNGSIQSGGASQYVTTNTGLLVANTWIHLAIVQNGSSLLVYKNGSLFQTLSCTNSPIIKPTIGARYSLSGLLPSGSLSDLRIYVTALSASDVKSLYQNSAYIDSSGNVYGAVHSEV